MLSFTKFKEFQGFDTKFQAVSRVQGAKMIFQAFQVFQGAVGTLELDVMKLGDIL